MQFDTGNAFISDALSVVRRYDPALYARMVADDWRVTTDADTYINWASITFTMGDYESMATAYGATLGEPHRQTWLNRPMIRDWAYEHGIPVSDFAASVLVHEYRHIHQSIEPYIGADAPDEIPAFEASSAFARKLPSYDVVIAALSDEHLREMRAY